MTMHNPPHPGGIIRRQCLDTLDLSVTEARKGLRVSDRLVILIEDNTSRIKPHYCIRSGNACAAAAAMVAPAKMARPSL
jgi:antitoxin HigA-1